MTHKEFERLFWDYKTNYTVLWYKKHPDFGKRIKANKWLELVEAHKGILPQLTAKKLKDEIKRHMNIYEAEKIKMADYRNAGLVYETEYVHFKYMQDLERGQVVRNEQDQAGPGNEDDVEAVIISSFVDELRRIADRTNIFKLLSKIFAKLDESLQGDDTMGELEAGMASMNTTGTENETLPPNA